MYKITYIHKDETTENVLYQPGSREYCLSAGNLDLNVGASGELSISIPQTNPAKDDFVCLTDEVIVYRDDKEIWRGRAMTRQYDFYLTGTLTCEGVLSYLYDTYYPPFEFNGSPSEFLQQVLDNHNTQVEDQKKIYLGNVTVEDNNDYIARSSIDYNRTLTVLTDKLINDSLGGYFRIRIENGKKYLDYLESYGTTATQAVEFGSNLLDIAQNVEYSDLATVILPLGAKLEDADGNQTDEYLTIKSVNGGSIYYADEAAVEEYGWIVVSCEWEDVTEASNLLTKAKNYLAQVTSAVASFEVNAVDLALLSDKYEAFNLGDFILIQSEPHGVNQYVELTEMSIDLLNPENDTYTFGSDTASLTESQKTSDRNVQTALESLQTKFTNLVTTVITTDYLNAKYITADDIAATYVAVENFKAKVAEFGYLTADELEALVGDFGYLTADSATITELYLKVSTIETAYIDTETAGTLLAGYVLTDDLDAAVANIVKFTTSDLYAAIADIGYLTVDSAVITEFTSDIGAINYLLSGYTSTETAQVINLSSANVVIADATITDAMIASVTADKLTAGTIYTDYVKIANNTGENMLIDGATIWMKDASGTYRMQLGLDASDEYNLYLWDADGNITFNTAGLTEEGLTGNGAIIRDAAVADDAAISGYKIDIESMTAYLNDYGQIVVGATNITIDDTTLDYKITEITGVLNSSVATITRYFALGDSDEEPPCEPGEEISSCIVGTFYVGEAIVDAETWEDIWTTERLIPDEDTYLWYADLVEKADGTSYWKTPTCVTDGYVKTTTSTLTTELEVIQGYIDARIWQTDITEAINAATGELTTTINDQYSELTLTINSISEEVGDLTTTVSDNYSELSGKVTSVETTVNGIETSISDINEYVSENYTSLNDKITTVSETVDGITTTISDLQTVVTDNYETLSSNITTLTTTTDGIAGSVSSLETTVGEYYSELSGQIEGTVTKVTYYYSLSDSDEEPSCEPEEELSNSIVGNFLVGQAVVDADSWEDIWSTEKKTAGEGTYLWIVAKVELADGSYYWTSYFCSTDGYVRDEAETLSEKYAELVVELDSITMQVSSLSTTIDGNYETLVEKISEVTLTAEAFETEVSETYATKKTVGSSDATEDADETTQDLLLDENGDPLSVYDALVKIASHLTQTSSSLSIEFEEVSADLSALVDGTIAGLQTDSETFSSKLSYVNITSEPAIELGASDSDFKVKITNSEIDFMDGDSKVAWISNQQLHITEAEVDIVNVGSKLSFWDSFSFINISGALVLVGEGYTEIMDDSEDDEIEEAS